MRRASAFSGGPLRQATAAALRNVGAMSESEARSVTVHGIVQGVGFRRYIERLAGEYGITGWVRNGADTSVRLHIEGTAEALDDFFIALNEDAPEAAVISGVEVSPAPAENHTAFSIRLDGAQ